MMTLAQLNYFCMACRLKSITFLFCLQELSKMCYDRRKCNKVTGGQENGI